MTSRDDEPNGGSGDPIDSGLADALERVGHVLRTQIRGSAVAHGLSAIQAQLLMRIAAVDEPDREPARLARWFDVTGPTISDAIAALRRKDLITSERVPGDKRRTRLALTPTGRTVAQQLADWDAPVRDLLAPIPAPAKDETLPLLLDLIARMQQSGLISIARTCSSCRFYRPPDPSALAGHCTLLDVPLPPESLRLDCPEHDPAA